MEDGREPLAVEAGPENPADEASFFHRMSTAPPYDSRFPISAVPNVVPSAFHGDWEGVMDEWGGHMKTACVRLILGGRRVTDTNGRKE